MNFPTQKFIRLQVFTIQALRFETLQIWILFAPLWGLVSNKRDQILKHSQGCPEK